MCQARAPDTTIPAKLSTIFCRCERAKRLKQLLKIINIDENSPLYGELIIGDKLLSINGQVVRDQLDYHFLSSEEHLNLEIDRDREIYTIELDKDYDEPLGLTFPEMKPSLCGNNCIFCFVDQFPPGARQTLQVKDEDYRFSFLHGNFITLSNLGKAGIERILKYRLSPLYISVHAMNPAVRNRLLGRQKDDGFLQKFRALAEGGITLHTQIVIVPGYNDGEILCDTIEKLAEFYPQTASIALIPLGLTKFRENLTPLRLLTPEECRGIIKTADKYRRKFSEIYDDPLVYGADELFLKAGMLIPPAKYYRDFPQIENGVGLARCFLQKFNREKRYFPKSISPQRKILMPSGTSTAPILQEFIAPVMNEIDGLTAEIVLVENDFFGDTVTVSGLLTGQDIITALAGKTGDWVLLPPDCLNYDNLFLDDVSLEQFQDELRMKVMKFDWSFREVFAFLGRI